MRLTRRSTLAGLGGMSLAALLAPSARADEIGLAQLARRKGIAYGSSVHARYLASDPGYRALVEQHCAVVVPEWEMKWRTIEPERGSRDYSRTDAILAFAEANGMRMRGHTAIWHQALPDWAPAILRGTGGGEVMLGHVADVVGHYSQRLDSFDIVNEAIDPKDGTLGDYRNSPYYRAFGADYVPLAFQEAHRVAPGLKLYYNELELDYDDTNSEAQRAGVLTLLEGMKTAGIPVHGLGIQGHLRIGRNYSAAKHRRFLADVAALGLEIMITEFDVNDSALPADIAKRDPEIAAHAKAYLDTALDETAVIGLLTWGISGKYSWLNDAAQYLRSDRQPTRGLPFDENFNKTALYDAIAAAFAGAPGR